MLCLEFGFSALPGGRYTGRNTDGIYYKIEVRSYWWSSAEEWAQAAWNWHMGTNFGNSWNWGANQRVGSGMRCIRYTAN